jgi:hypothetical protein
MAAQPVEQFAQDLHFVREAVETSRAVHYRSMAIPLLWAVVILVGFTINNFGQLATVGLYWAIVSPIAGIASGWLGMRAERSAGVQSDRVHGSRQTLHWLTIFFGFFAVAAITASHGMDGRLAGQLMTLVFGIVYFLGGLHLDARFLFPGLAAIAGSAAIDHLGPYSWTIVGAVIAMALVASAFWKKESDVQGTTQS